jgi:orotidine-5'-phosphate decarboxylase
LPPSVAAERGSPFIARLGRRVDAVHNTLCLGLDPDPQALPEGWSRDIRGVERFAALLLDTCLEHAVAVKANVAFYEAFGSPGIAALERIRARVPNDVPFIADAKRGDISSTVARQAVALYDALGADAVTANPYLGGDAIAPLLERSDRFVYVLCRTSNPGAAEIQNLLVERGEPLYIHVARRATEWAADGGNVGLVVGATAPVELELIRAAAPALAMLVPGVGAQGGDIDAVRRSGPAVSGAAAAIRGGALLVNVSRGIAAAAVGTADPEAALSAAAARWAALLQC